MGLCTSGDLSILGAAGTNRSIACEVDGNITPPKSLCSLSVSAGKTAPHGMTEFYGYSSVKCIDFSNINNNPTNRLDQIVSTPSMSAGQCYSISLSWGLCTNGSHSNASICVICNSTTIYFCSVGEDANCNNTFSSFNIDDNDNVCVCLVVDKALGTSAKADSTISSISGVVGNFCKGNNCTYISVLDSA